MSTTSAILSRVRALGWKVQVRHEAGAVSIECEDLRHKRKPHFVRVRGHESSDEEREYLAACELAGAVGIDLE